MRVSESVILALLLLGTGCDRPAPDSLESGGFETAAERIGRALAATGCEFDLDDSPPVVGDPSTVPPGDRAAPPGYLLVTPTARSGDFGHVVLLIEPLGGVVVPIFIGGTEALSIQLRLAGDEFTRPLTHDLFDAFRQRLGVTMVRAQVDMLKDNIYTGTVVFIKGGRTIMLDARPSDAIALAIGNKAPIYVSETVLERAGLRREDIERGDPEPPKGNPVAL